MCPSKLWPGVEYLIRTDLPVCVLKDGQRAAELCVLTAHGEPEADRLMSILDLLETDERRLWEMGNMGFLNYRPFRRRVEWIELYWLAAALVIAAMFVWYLYLVAG